MSRAILEDLNPRQRDAILHTGGPLLILAGAGSGKTRVITHKFAYLTSKRLPAGSILTLTFTNKAANEMKGRIATLIGKDLGGEWIGTFHSQCNRILRREIKALGYRPNFSIYDDDDQSHLIRHILKDFKIYEALYRGILSRISSLKSACITPEEFLSKGEGFGFEERLARVYVRYQDELRRCNALDYDDLIMLCTKLFREKPDVLQKYGSRFRHILVDEFQDTNRAQYMLLKQLASDNLSAVGDDDQSIYGFRGADVNNILGFERDFPGATVIKLETNYRSTRNILHVSGSVIKKNSRRKDKELRGERMEGESVCQCWFPSEEEEAKYVAKLIKEFYLKDSYDFSHFAVLYRTNLQSRPLEDALRHERLPYKVLGGMSFYQRREVRDIIAYMKLAVNCDDNVSLRRIINVPPRGIGASTLSRLEHEAKNKSVSLFQAIRNTIKTGSLTASLREKLDGFAALIEKLSGRRYKHAGEMIKTIFEQTRYSEFADDDRIEHIKQLIASGEGQEIKEFLDRVCLISSLDEANGDNAISLLTLHSAKGLEFPVVFITGLEEGVLPYFKAKTPHEIEEERRLLYVGMTRAKDRLTLTGAGRRRLYSKIQEQEVSRFLRELPEGSCQNIAMPAIGKCVSVAQSGGRSYRSPKVIFAHKVASRVKHERWGVGVVMDCYGEGNDQKITVNFPKIGLKRLAIRFAHLQKVT